jgi:hypothetical protein
MPTSRVLDDMHGDFTDAQQHRSRKYCISKRLEDIGHKILAQIIRKITLFAFSWCLLCRSSPGNSCLWLLVFRQLTLTTDQVEKHVHCTTGKAATTLPPEKQNSKNYNQLREREVMKVFMKSARTFCVAVLFMDRQEKNSKSSWPDSSSNTSLALYVYPETSKHSLKLNKWGKVSAGFWCQKASICVFQQWLLGSG